MPFWNSSNSSSALGFPAKTSIATQNKSLAQQIQLPQRMNAQQATQAIQKASELEGSVKARSIGLQGLQRQLNAYGNLYQQDAQFATARMRLAERMAQTDARFGKATMDHQLAMGVQRAEVTGYESAMQVFSA